MSIALFVIAFVALAVQVVGAFFVIYVALQGTTGAITMAATLLLAAAALLVAYGHLVFIALLHRRLRREGRHLRIPNAIARVLARLLDGIGYAV